VKAEKIRSAAGVFSGQKGKLNLTKFKRRPKVTKKTKRDAEIGSRRKVCISKGDHAMALEAKWNR